MLKNKNGFTLIELLVAIFIIALISTLVTVSFLNIKRNNRDAKRINDVTEIQMALENYKFFEGSYPSELTPGEPLIGSSSGNIYMAQVPENPEYQSYDCPFGSYDYFYDPDDGKYKISFCLEGKIENYTSGLKCAISEGIVGEKCIPLTVATGNPANGQVSVAYSGHTFSALSGTEPYTFSVASGSSLPAGLSLSSAGSLTGTPTTYGDYDFFIQVSDAESATNSREFSMTIDPAVLALGSSSPTNGEEGTVYAGHTFSASGGVPSYTFSLASGSLPAGLSLSSAGSLTGTTTAQGSYNFTIKVVDSLLVEDTENFVLVVDPPFCGLVVSYGGENYSTSRIGNQCWFSKSLNIGSMINSSVNQTNNSVAEKYCYNNSESNCTAYGGLYQWNELMQYVTTDGAQGLCPSGWHIPTDAEWTTLTNYLSANNPYWCNSNSTYIAKSIASTSGWQDSGVPCNVGNSQATNNYSGLNFLPGGMCGANKSFSLAGSYIYVWTSTSNGSSNSWYRYIGWGSSVVDRTSFFMNSSSFYVRCLKN